MDLLGLLLLFLTGCASLGISSSASFASTASSSQILHVTLGGLVRLHCDMGLFAGNNDKDSAAHNMPVIWQRWDMEDTDNSVLVSHGEALMLDDPRLTLSQGASILTIKDAQLSDSGTYQCMLASDSDEIASPYIEVIVKSHVQGMSNSTSTVISSSFTLLVLYAALLLR